MDQGDTWADCEAVIERTPVTKHIDIGDTAHTSPYGEIFRNGATIFPRVLTFVEIERPTTGLGLSRRVEQVRSVRSAQLPWKDVPVVAGTVERRFLHPTHLGSTLLPFRMLSPKWSVLPFDMHDGIVEDFSIYPHMRQWWEDVTRLWREHGTGKTTLVQQLDHMRKLSAQRDAAPIRVVYSASGSRLAAAVVDDATAIVEHALYWAAMPSRESADYLVAVLNAMATQRLVEPYQPRGQQGARHYDMYVWRLPIPLYDPGNELHAELSYLGRHAADVAATVDVGDYGFQRARKLVRDALDAEGTGPQIEKLVRRLYGDDATA